LAVNKRRANVIYFTDSFIGHCPVGAARALIVATSKRRAIVLLKERMLACGLEDQIPDALEGLKIVKDRGQGIVNFSDGDY